MADANQRRAKELLLDALDTPPAERAAFVDAACAGDPSLRARVDELLAAHARSTDLEIMAGEGATAPWAGSRGTRDSEVPLALVGDYELFEELGRGAAGTVYRARQTSLGREVAIKVLRAGSLAQDTDVRRFRREAEAAAALDHAGIVPVFDIGEFEGHHFFSMKRIDGPSLDRVVGEFAHRPRDAAKLVAAVARAVHHAHNRGVLHRDLKPSNILLDAGGEPHVADFGIARPLGGARVTQTGLICGTPAYMSPEQARGDRDVTVATDVWSLGCVLHELLAGQPPFDGDGVADVLRRVQEMAPPTLVDVDSNLATIAGACLAKDAGRRYPSALALAEDLERWLDHRPITARPITRFERLRLLCRRSPVATSLGIAVAALLLILGIGASSASLVLRQRLQETREANDRSNERLRSALIATARAERRSDLAGRREVGLDLLVQAAAIEPGADIRNEAITTLTLPDLVTTAAWRLETGTALAADRAFEQVAIATPDGRVELRSATTGESIEVIPAGGSVARNALFTHGGRRLWLRRYGDSRLAGPALEVWDVAAQPPAVMHRRAIASTCFACNGDGSVVALARYEDNGVELIDADTFEVTRVLSMPKRPEQCAFRPDGGALAASTGDGNSVEIVSLPDGQSQASLELADYVYAIAWSPDGERLIAGCFDQLGYVFETSTWRPREILRGHEGEIVGVALFPGRLAATTAWDGSTRIWDVEVGTELLRTPAALITVDTGSCRALLNNEGTLSVVQLVVDDVLQVLHGHEGKAPREVAESPDGTLLATCGDFTWRLWNAHTGAALATTPAKMIHSIVFEPGGASVLTSGEEGVLRWPLAGRDIGEPEVVVEGSCMRASQSPDGRWLGVVRHGTGLLIDGDGEPKELGRHRGLDRVAFSPDGRWIAIGSWSGDGLRVWDTATGELQAHLAAGEVSAMGTFSPDGELLLIATYDEVSVVRTGSWELERSFEREGPRRPGVPAAFSPRGSLVAVGIAHARVRLMRVDGWQVIADLEPADPRSLFHMRFLDEGHRLAVATTGHRLLIWNLGAAWAELVQRGLAEPDELWRHSTK